MIRVLLCSPFYKDKDSTTCGIANWTRNILSEVSKDQEVEVELLPFDRSVDLYEESSVFERLVSGVKDYGSLIKQVYRKLRKSKYDIIHISTSGSIGLFRDYILARLAHIYKTKVVFHYHFGRIPDLLEKPNWESALLRRVVKKSTATIVMTDTSYRALCNGGYKDVYYLPNPIANSIVTKIDTIQKNTERQDNTILFVGHVVKTKGIYELVEACSRIEGVSLNIIGTCSESTKLEIEKIANHRDGGIWMNLLGAQSRETVISAMCACDIFALPTYTEGFPNVILESMACSCSIVTCGVGAIPEILEMENSNTCGLIVDPRDVNSLEETIRQLLLDNEKKETLRYNAREKVVNTYTTAAVWKQLRNIWEKI